MTALPKTGYARLIEEIPLKPIERDAGYRRAAFSMAPAGTRELSKQHIRTIAAALRISTDYLLASILPQRARLVRSNSVCQNLLTTNCVSVLVAPRKKR